MIITIPPSNTKINAQVHFQDNLLSIEVYTNKQTLGEKVCFDSRKTNLKAGGFVILSVKVNRNDAYEHQLRNGLLMIFQWRRSIMIESIEMSEPHLCSLKQIIIVLLKCLCLSYITTRNNDTINNQLAHTHTRTQTAAQMITLQPPEEKRKNDEVVLPSRIWL